MKVSFCSSRRAATLAVFALSASTATAGFNPFHAARRNERSSWAPARQTGEPLALPGEVLEGDYAQNALVGAHNFWEEHEDLFEALTTAPAPTTAPSPVAALLSPEELKKRASTDNTCGYLSGWSTYPFTCPTTDACVIKSYNSVVGCCPDTSLQCPLFTTCLAQSQSAIWSANANQTAVSSTLLCSSDAYPECVTHIYEDDVFSGYILYGCGRTKAIDSVYYTPTILSSSTSSSSSSSSSSSDSSSSSTSTSSSSTVGPATTTVIASPTSESKKSTNVGAIVGGVVGGVGGLAVLALAGFLILRHRRKNANTLGGAAAGTGAAGAAGGPAGGQPPMQQTYANPTSPQTGGYPGSPQTGYAGSPSPGTVGGYGAPLAAGAAGGAAAGYAVGQHGADPYNPHNSLAAGTVSPTTTAVQGSEAGSPYTTQSTPKPGMGYHSGPVPSYEVAELPTERADGELRELA